MWLPQNTIDDVNIGAGNGLVLWLPEPMMTKIDVAVWRPYDPMSLLSLF